MLKRTLVLQRNSDILTLYKSVSYLSASSLYIVQKKHFALENLTVTWQQAGSIKQHKNTVENFPLLKDIGPIK